MDISGAHQQAMASHGLEEILGSCSNIQPQPERKPRTQPEQALKCPRCDSTNTKFCYYNNYSLSQPRYFCKGCRRYWTKGGSLRNVPVGGGCRKNKRSSSSSSSSSSNPNSNSLRSRPQDHQSFISSNSIPPLPSLPPSLPSLSYEHSDLTLAFARLQNQQQQQWPVADHETFFIGNPNPNPVPGVGFLNIMRSGFVENGGRNGFHNFYSGFSGSCSAVEDVEGSTTTTGGQEVLLPTENSSTAGEGEEGMSSEGWCKAVGGGESKVLMGLQWPIGVDGGMGMEWVLH